MMKTLLLGAGLVLAAGCGEKQEAPAGASAPTATPTTKPTATLAEAPADSPGATESTGVRIAREELVKIKAALAAGTAAGMECAGAQGALKRDTSDAGKPLKAELEQVCGYDVPLLAVTTATKQAEDARAANPTKQPLSECYSAEYELALKVLEPRHAADAKVMAVKDRWAKVCPAK